MIVLDEEKNQRFGFCNQAITKSDRRRRIVLSDKGDDFTKVLASWFSKDYFVIHDRNLRFDFLKGENSALLGCSDTFINRSH